VTLTLFYIPRLVKTETVMLTLMWAVTLNAFIGAINARGPARVTLSFLLAILCLCASVFHTSKHVVASRSLTSAIEVSATTTPPGEVLTPPSVDTAGLAGSQQAAAVGAARNEIRQLVETSRRLAERLSAVNLNDVSQLSDAEYDALQSKAFGFRTEAGRLRERLTSLLSTLPAPLKSTGETVNDAVSQLTVAVQNYERFFKAENDGEETQRQQAFQRMAGSALAALRQVQKNLEASSDPATAAAP